MIEFFLGLAQNLSALSFDRRNTVPMYFLQPLISRISKNPYLLSDKQLGFFKELEVMLLSGAESRRKYFQILRVDDDLRFERVAFFLPRIVPPLFFLGR